MSTRRSFEQADETTVAKVHKLRRQGLTNKVIATRLGCSEWQVTQLAKRSTNEQRHEVPS